MSKVFTFGGIFNTSPVYILKDIEAEAPQASEQVTWTVYTPFVLGTPENLYKEGLKLSQLGIYVAAHLRESPLGSTKVLPGKENVQFWFVSIY